MNSLADRLREEFPEVATVAGKSLLALICTLPICKNPLTRFDFGVTLERVMEGFGVEHGLPQAYNYEDRPECDDTRPLLHRLEDEHWIVSGTVLRVWRNLCLADREFEPHSRIRSEYIALLDTLEDGLNSSDPYLDLPRRPNVALSKTTEAAIGTEEVGS